MWQLFIFLIGFVVCSTNEQYVETLAGVDLSLHCTGIITTDRILSITWTRSNGSIVFNCDTSTVCEANTSIHTLIRHNMFISTVTIRNVSLVHEDEYTSVMVAPFHEQTCTINLIVNVPPKGLILVEKNSDNILQNKGSLTVPEGGNKILVCKTNTSVKPAVDLEWVFPKELNPSVDSQKYVNDESDERLLVPTRKIHFTSTYAEDEGIVLICKVVSNSSLDYIHTSVLIRNEGSRTSYTTPFGPSEQGSGTSYTTHVGPSSQEPMETPWYKQSHLVILGCSGVVMLLILLAFIGGFIRSKKRDERLAAPAIQTSRNLPEDDKSHTSKPTRDVQSLDMTFNQSDPTYAIPDVSEVTHTYMAMKPTVKRKSPASISQQVCHPTTSVDDLGGSVLYVSPTIVRKQVQAHPYLKEEPTYVNSEGASTFCEISTDIPNIVGNHADGHDDVLTTYH